MKCLGALPSVFLTSIRKDFVRQIMDVYYFNYNCRAPRPFYKISSLSFLPHILQFNLDWKSIPVDLFFARFAVQYDVTSTFDMSQLFDHWQIARISQQFHHFCDQLFAHRIHVRQNLLVSLKKITTWNISGWRPPTQRGDFKMSVIRRHLKKGPVCLQETRWTSSMTAGMQQRFNAVQICSSDAIPTINGGTSGGVAVLVPTSLQVIDTSIIVPGRALAVQVSSRTAKFWIFSVYLHPASKQTELQDICKWIRNGNIPNVPCVVSGDFNRIDREYPDDWNSFLSLLGIESTIQGKTTFVGPKGESSIDDVLVPTEYMQNSSLWPKVYLEKNYQQSGHATIGVEFQHRPSVSSTESFASHATIPSNVYQPGKDLMDFRQATKETDSVAKLLRRLHSTQEISFRNLQIAHWQWFLSEPPAEKLTLYNLRKHIHSAKPLVHVRIPLMEALLARCPLYSFSLSTANQQHGHVIVPKKLIADCFEYIDQTTTGDKGLMHSNHMQSSMRGLGSQTPMWQSLRQSCPKTVFYHGPILKGNGLPCTTDLDLQEAMLDTRKFWFDRPCEFDEQWHAYLKCYQEQSCSWSDLCFPAEQDYIKTLFFTKDSSPGPDGIPYAAWRLVPSLSAKAMQAFLYDVLDDQLPPPVSIQAWIPKAKLGPTADFFRPLGMPSTFERVVDGTIASYLVKFVASTLHPAQVVLNEFREPQQGVHNIQEVLDSHTAAVALSLDLSKAFERINPYWILHILAIRNAPYWVIQYTKYILFGRRAKQKVQGKLLPAKEIATGVDMGRSFSVLLFCIAMDPILSYLNQIPGVLRVQGYVDDTTLVGDTRESLQWLYEVGQLCSHLLSAGIKVDPHSCWRAAFVNSTSCPCTLMTPLHPLEWILNSEGKSTLTDAISPLQLHRHHHGFVAICRERFFCVISVHKLRQLSENFIPEILDMISYKCACSNKCGILSNTILTSGQLAALDKGHWGMHLLQDSLPALGLHLIGRFTLVERKWKEVDFQHTFTTTTPKAMTKILHRMSIFSSPAHSVVKKSIAHASFIQSCTYYPSTYLGFTPDDVSQFRQMQSKLLLGRKWLVAEHIPHIFRWLNIAPTCDPGIEMTLAAVGYFLRRGGNILLLLPGAHPATDRHTVMVQEIWKPWHPILPEDTFLSLATPLIQMGGYKAVRKFLTKLKNTMYELVQEPSITYLYSRVQAAVWPGGVNWDWLSMIASLPNKVLQGVARFSLLRWCLGEDDEEGLALRVVGQLHRDQPCCHCSQLCRVYPFGLDFYPVCDHCCQFFNINALTLNTQLVSVLNQHFSFMSLISADTLPTHSFPQQPVSLADRSHEFCIACGQGDNSIAHWSRFCLVPLFVALYFLNEPHTLTNLAQIANHSTDACVIASVVIHQFRRMLIDRGGMMHTRADRQEWSSINWINTLGQQVHQALPSHIARQSWPDPCNVAGSSCPDCREHAEFIKCTSNDPTHILSLTLADQIVHFSESVTPGSTVALLPAGHALLKLLHWQRSSVPPNATLTPVGCSCTIPHFQLRCVAPVAAGDLIELGSALTHPVRPYVLGQFDGGCHSSVAVGGAGYGIYLVYPDSVQLYCWRSIGLAKCSDNVVAEVKACKHLVDDIVALTHGELQHLDLLRSHTIIQGDILPVIKFLSLSCRLRRVDLVDDLEHIQHTASQYFSASRWRALPREANELADDLAGQATKHMLKRYLQNTPCHTDVCLKPELPIAKLVSRGGEPCAIPLADIQPTFTLLESPTLQWPLLERLGAKHPNQLSVVKAYLGRLISNGNNVLVDYVPTSSDSLGRCYAVQVGAQRLSRKFRLALFGSTHVEVDICGSFYEIVRRFQFAGDTSQLTLPHIHELRSMLTAFFAPYAIATQHQLSKKLPLRIMNSTPSETFLWLSSLGLPPLPPPVRQILCTLHERTHTVTQILAPQLRPTACRGSRDFVFRVLEVQEYLIMSHIFHSLTSRGLVHSAIWLHDGFWISPTPDFALLQEITCLTLVQFGFQSDGVFLRMECLQSKYRSLLDEVAHLRVPSPSIFASLRKVKVKEWAKHTVVFGRGRQLIHTDGLKKHIRRKQKHSRVCKKFAVRFIRSKYK